MGDVVGGDGEPPGEGGGANEHVLNVDRPAYGPEMGQHVAGHEGFFNSMTQMHEVNSVSVECWRSFSSRWGLGGFRTS